MNDRLTDVNAGELAPREVTIPAELPASLPAQASDPDVRCRGERGEGVISTAMAVHP